MSRHAGTSFALSLLIVVGFAVAFYQPDPATLPPSARSSPEHPSGSATRPAAASRTAAQDPTQRTAQADRGPETDSDEGEVGTSVSPGRSDPIQTSSLAARSSPARAQAVERTRTAPAPALPDPNGQPQPPRTTAPRPRGAFTRVEPGETLAEIAARVYGSSASARTLWLANRDLIDSQDAPLRAGALLRTP
jgi:nucleoid-associated protein YgaU